MKNITSMFVSLIAAVALCAPAFGQGYGYAGADASVPALIRYIPGDGYLVSTIVAEASVIVGVSDDTTVGGTITLTPTKTLATVLAEIEAYTNSAGLKVFDCELWEGLSADTVSNKLLAGTYVLKNQEWDTQLKWDTSTCLHYSVIPDAFVNGKPVGGYYIKGVAGDAAGTGTWVLNVYENDTTLFKYNVVTNDIHHIYDANLALATPIKIGNGKRGVVRVTRGTTATTGVIGVGTDKNR